LSFAEVIEGKLFRAETVDWTAGAIGDNSSAEDVKCLDLFTVHNLSGPIKIVDAEGMSAKPGDILVVEICNLGPLPGDEWGYTGTF
jgi:formamidase